MQQRAAGWNQARSRCGKDKAFVHGASALLGKLEGAPSVLNLMTIHLLAVETLNMLTS